jgi:hypothetical protein
MRVGLGSEVSGGECVYVCESEKNIFIPLAGGPSPFIPLAGGSVPFYKSKGREWIQREREKSPRLCPSPPLRMGPAVL